MVAAALLLWAATATSRGKYRLPPEARITIGKVEIDAPVTDRDRDECGGFSLTEREVRMMFRTYRLYIPAQDYESYDDSPCHIVGTIVYDGKTYTFDSEDGEKMRSTTWPDGKEKTLCGKPTDWKDFQ